MAVDEGYIKELLLSEFNNKLHINRSHSGFIATFPFSNYIGEPIEVSIGLESESLIVDDLGRCAGLLFSLGQHGEDAQGYLLTKNLTQAHGISIDRDRGLLTKRITLSNNLSELIEFVSVILSIQIVMSELSTRKRPRLRRTYLRSRLSEDFKQLVMPLKIHVDKQTQISGRHEIWSVDYRYFYKQNGSLVDVAIIVADLESKEPRYKAEHVVALALDVLDNNNLRDLRIIYELNGHNTDSPARRAAGFIEDSKHVCKYKLFNYADSNQKANFLSLTAKELSLSAMEIAKISTVNNKSCL